MTNATKTTAHMTLLCASLLGANAVWSCPDKVDAENAPKLSAAQPQTPSASRLHDLFHDPNLNRPDNLGDYTEDFRAAYPN